MPYREMPKKTDGRKGKQRLPIIDNIVYSNLIFQVALGNNYAQKIFEAFGKQKEVSVILKQLKTLEDEGFVSSEIKEDRSVFPMKKIRIYSINWERINQEFFDFIKNKSKNPNLKIPEKYAKNKLFSLYLKEIFARHEKIKATVIKDIFESLSIALLESLVPISESSKPKELGELAKILELINPSNWENNLFVEESEKILFKIAEDNGIKVATEEDLDRIFKSSGNGIEATKPTEKGQEKSRDTPQNKASTTEKGENKNGK